MIAAAAIVALSLSGCSAASEPPRASGAITPALWVVKDPDTTVYLFGTVHLLPKGTKWDDKAVGTAIASADELVLELAPDQMAAAPAAFQRHALDRADGPVLARLPDDLREPAAAAIDATQFKGGALDRFETWAVALLLAQSTAAAEGLDLNSGVEKVLTERFRDRSRPIHGLETADEQIRLFDSLPLATQRTMLEKVIRDRGVAPQRLAALLSAWQAGDVARLNQIVAEDMTAIDGLNHPLLIDRNRHWARWIDQRMDRPGTVLVAVGAAHLVGDGSVQDALVREGQTVTRIQ